MAVMAILLLLILLPFQYKGIVWNIMTNYGQKS